MDPIRVEHRTVDGTADLCLVEDIYTAEDTTGVIDLVESHWPAGYRNINATGKFPFDFGYTKWCTTSP